MEPPEAHVPHRAHTGHRWVDMLLTLTAVLVSAISLYVAIDNGRSMERLVAANSWPNLQADGSVTQGDAQGSVKASIVIKNNGVGPARLETLEIWGDDGPIADGKAFAEWIKRLGGGTSITGRLEGSTAQGNVIGAGDSIEIVGLTAPDAALWAKPFIRAASGAQTRICYCSVFEDCYVSDSRLKRGRPRPVKQCPKPSAPYDDDLSKVFIAQPTPQQPSAKALPQ